ncbi:MAG: type II toxin-antitoxin system RelE/ParE family toxin [Methanoregulaceae archaeon]|nr:MAG: type II toxin-antitoxin system RelE/ParE family toxin [Methanoregulaceae archaeon]
MRPILIISEPEPGCFNSFFSLFRSQKKWRRVHIGHFVLFYVIDAKENAIVFLKLLHHDEAYNQGSF